MNTFEDRLRAAVRAGWWIVALAAAVLTLQWLAYLVLTAQQPSWFLWLWGHGATWPQVQGVWLAAMAVFKLCIWVLALIVLWATVWRRMLIRR
jgi:hypothetical protein